MHSSFAHLAIAALCLSAPNPINVGVALINIGLAIVFVLIS